MLNDKGHNTAIEDEEAAAEKNISKQKTKVLRIFSRLNIGGPAIHTILLTAGLNDNQFESILVKGREDKDEGNMLYLAEEKSVKPVIIPEMGRNISFLDDLKACFKLYQLILKEKPDIVHTHTAKAGTLGRVAVILVRMKKTAVRVLKKMLFYKEKNDERYLGPKTVHTFHGHIFTGYFNPLISKIFLLTERVLARFTDIIITVSEEQRKEILKLGIRNKKKVITVPLGLELKRFINNEGLKGKIREELNLSEDIKLVGIVGRLVPIKNHKMFIDAVSRLKEKEEKIKARFLIIGDGELRKELEQYVKNRGLEQDIMFLGFRRDLETLYADIDILVLTSLNEGLPVVVIEAMASGKSVISTDVGGVVDLLEDDDHQSKDNEEDEKEKTPGKKEEQKKIRITDYGILVKSGDDEALAEALEKLLKNDSLRTEMGEKGRERVYPRYDFQRLLKDMKELYLKIA